MKQLKNRSEKLTVRLTENEYNSFASEAQNNNMTVSAYARLRLVYSDHREISAKEIDNRYTEESVTVEKHELQNKLIQLEHYIELLPDKNKNKDIMKDLVREAWRLLR